jgi:hypothetical protein
MLPLHVAVTTVTFSKSVFPPIAVGFFGLATGYLIYGAQELFGYPSRPSDKVDLTTGIWGVWMPGFMQFITGVYLFVGLTWFGSFQSSPPLYMAALAFTAYGVHWWALGMQRAMGGDPRPNALMSIAFLVLSVLGIVVFFHHGVDDPVGGVFIGLTAVYICEFFATFHLPLAEKALGLSRLATAGWLLYLTCAAALNFAAGYHLTL